METSKYYMYMYFYGNRKTQEIIITSEGTRFVKDGKDWHRLKMVNLRNLGFIFQDETGQGLYL